MKNFVILLAFAIAFLIIGGWSDDQPMTWLSVGIFGICVVLLFRLLVITDFRAAKKEDEAMRRHVNGLR